MILKEELFLGALVYVWHYDKPEERIPVEIKGLFESEHGIVYFEFFLNGERCSRPMDDCETIPVSKEILYANGWTGEGYITYHLEENMWLEYYPYESRLRKYSTVPDEWDNHSKERRTIFESQCHYVHKLQNALNQCAYGVKIKI